MDSLRWRCLTLPRALQWQHGIATCFVFQRELPYPGTSRLSRTASWTRRSWTRLDFFTASEIRITRIILKCLSVQVRCSGSSLSWSWTPKNSPFWRPLQHLTTAMARIWTISVRFYQQFAAVNLSIGFKPFLPLLRKPLRMGPTADQPTSGPASRRPLQALQNTTMWCSPAGRFCRASRPVVHGCQCIGHHHFFIWSASDSLREASEHPSEDHGHLFADILLN